MSSLLTNSAAMTALQTLTATNKKMEVTQNRIATGQRVTTAADNAAYWSIATTMRADNKALGAVQDALGLGAATVDVAYTALTSIIDLSKEIVAKVTAAGQEGVDRDKVLVEINQLQSQIESIRDSAFFNGVNLLNGSQTGGISIVASFSRDGAGTVSLETMTFDTTTSDLTTEIGGFLDAAMNGMSTWTDPAADASSLLDTLNDELTAMTDVATNLGAIKNRIGLQQDFVKALKDAIDRGVGQLVDADMNAESTRLQALQVQQQLGIQALSIANSNSQNILSLFR